MVVWKIENNCGWSWVWGIDGRFKFGGIKLENIVWFLYWNGGIKICWGCGGCMRWGVIIGWIGVEKVKDG